MTLSDIAALAGKGGLFKILKPTRTGVILESLDEKKAKLIAGTQHRISVLEEISIYTTTGDGSVPLSEIFPKIKDEFDDDPGLDKNADADEYKAFLKHILPEFDEDRVYPSDIKKLVAWYKILYQYAPEVLSPQDENDGDKKTAAKKPDK